MLRTLFSYSSSKLKLGLISQGCEQHDQYRAVGAWRGMPCPPPDFYKSDNPTLTSEADYARHINTCSPDFLTVLRPCIIWG